MEVPASSGRQQHQSDHSPGYPRGGCSPSGGYSAVLGCIDTGNRTDTGNRKDKDNFDGDNDNDHDNYHHDDNGHTNDDVNKDNNGDNGWDDEDEQVGSRDLRRPLVAGSSFTTAAAAAATTTADIARRRGRAVPLAMTTAATGCRIGVGGYVGVGQSPGACETYRKHVQPAGGASARYGRAGRVGDGGGGDGGGIGSDAVGVGIGGVGRVGGVGGSGGGFDGVVGDGGVGVDGVGNSSCHRLGRYQSQQPADERQRPVLRAWHPGERQSIPRTAVAHGVYTAAPPPPPAVTTAAASATIGASGAAVGAMRADWSAPERLAARLGELEKKLVPEREHRQGLGAGRGCYGGFGSVLGGTETGDAGRLASAAVDDVQSATLRHALLLEERGLQLEEAEKLLRRKGEEEIALRRELQRFAEASIVDKDLRRRLSEAEGEISSLSGRAEILEGLVRESQANLEAEVRGRLEDAQQHASEMELARERAAEEAEAAAREGMAAQSSRELCEQMGGVCKQMRQAAEDAGKRSAEAEESVRSLEAELATTGLRAKDAERELKSLRATVESDRREAAKTVQACAQERDAAVALRGLLEDREARLERAESDASKAGLKTREAAQETTRHRKTSEDLRAELELSLREAEGLRSRLHAAELGRKEAVDEAGQAREAASLARSQLASTQDREKSALAENESLAKKSEELRVLLAKASADLSDSAKLAHERSIASELSSRAAAEADRRLEEQKNRADEERDRRETAVHEARLAAKSAVESVTFRSETIRMEGACAFARFQEQVALALRRVEDALADALRGVGEGGGTGGSVSEEGFEWGLLTPPHELPSGRESPWAATSTAAAAAAAAVAAAAHIAENDTRAPSSNRDSIAAATAADIADNATRPSASNRNEHHRHRDYGYRGHDDDAGFGSPQAGDAAAAVGGERGGRGSARGETSRGFSFVKAAARGRAGATSDAFGSTAGEAAAAAAAAAAMASRLERMLSRIMRRLGAAKGFRAWVLREADRAGAGANERLKELGGRWEEDVERLKKAEGEVARLKEEAQHGSRKAVLEAQEKCYAKLERVDMDKQSLRDSLASEEQKVEVLRGDLKRLKEGADKAASSSEVQRRSLGEELEGERSQRRRLQEKTELLEGKASLLQEKLSVLSEQLDRFKAGELEQQRQTERLLSSQKSLESQLAHEKYNAEEARKLALENSQKVSEELCRQRQEDDESREQEARRLKRLLEEERCFREEEAVRMSGLLEEERVAREEEARRFTFMLEEERKARLEESALGEAVLREVQETQGLLGKVSPRAGRSTRSHSGSRTFLGAGRGTSGGKTSGTAAQSATYFCSASMEKQASMLRRLASDTAGLVKLTGSFFDRYSDTHRAKASTVGGGGAPAAPADGGLLRNAPGNFHSGSHNETGYSGGYYGSSNGMRRSGGGGGVMGPFGANSGRHYVSGNFAASATNQPRSAENSVNFLDRTVEYGKGGGADLDGAAAVRELDRRCYSLLEANAQLCLKLQALGLEYAGLTRELLDSESKLPCRGGVLGVSDLDTGNFSDDVHRGRRRGGDNLNHNRRVHGHHHRSSSSGSSSNNSNSENRNDRRCKDNHHYHHRHHHDDGNDRCRRQKSGRQRTGHHPHHDEDEFNNNHRRRRSEERHRLNSPYTHVGLREAPVAAASERRGLDESYSSERYSDCSGDRSEDCSADLKAHVFSDNRVYRRPSPVQPSPRIRDAKQLGREGRR